MTWKELSKEQINQMLNDLIEQIFCNCDRTSMTKYEKRKRIYDIWLKTKNIIMNILMEY